MLEPFDADHHGKETCKIVIDVVDLGDRLRYNFYLEVPDSEYIRMSELQALKEGLEVALERMKVLLRRLDDDE